MTEKQRKLRRQQLDRQIGELAPNVPPSAPQGGWIQAIREALGMTLDSFGKRLGISRQSAHQLELAEVKESITLARLRSAAEALECELIIHLRPKQPLEELVRTRAHHIARDIVLRTGHSMFLEEQAVSDERIEELIRETAEELVARKDSRLWQ